MKRVILEELDKENTFFHFTRKENIKSIEQNGLMSTKGQNAKNVEITPKIFFSKGIEGILELTDVWIKWMMNNAYSMKNLYGFYDTLSKQETMEKASTWDKEFRNKSYLEDKEKKEKVFNIVYEKMKQTVYLSLELEEGVDFDYRDIDENKEKSLQLKRKGNIVNYLYTKEMYGSYSNVDSIKMEKWNMHTKMYKNIDKEKISQVVTKSGQEDILSIIKTIYQKENNKKYDILNDYMEYIEKRNS